MSFPLAELALGTGVFTGIVMVLVLVVLAARTLILPVGNVSIVVNDKRTLEGPRGSRLLGILAANGLYLPSPCGGSGTCGQCRVQVVGGGGPQLPTEAAHITRREARTGIHLACQLTVNDRIAIQLPEAVLGVDRWTCRVRSTRSLATFIREIVLDLPPGRPMTFRAGGYVQVECPPHAVRFEDFDLPPGLRDEWQRYGLLALQSNSTEPVTRAYSMANYPGEGADLTLNIRIATPPPRAPAGTPPGIVSSWLFSLQPGDELTVLGPFGEFFAREGDAEMVFIGGGAGMAPMRSHILDQLLRLDSQRLISFWYGARSLREALYVDEFEKLAQEHDNFSWHLALSEPKPEDQWHGPVGFIHDVLRREYLDSHRAPEDCEYYLCGPPMMVAAVTDMLDGLGVEPGNILFDDFGG